MREFIARFSYYDLCLFILQVRRTYKAFYSLLRRRQERRQRAQQINGRKKPQQNYPYNLFSTKKVGRILPLHNLEQ